ncbi:tRNA (N6-threonylcarbamoyladenosine(37)-N6)-methyltransferase TrmO [Litorilituus sediminis]|uniref:tRNA (N6-threonylcarbamoyladenosine(37)-N6)-methyltransferase TrmO n=1 Tax=Litorilituus sediminis TaxID=718192 RepID=A0A4P6P0Q3_9GAMM|nr:tRNA (N6-threonylcarbamoyladenosine(37)-N6)-methyltransferase TrmO [Litorilituus sediminis]QBG34716.1 tRNA (N6-threonylcarbamoyladenosine(37)-N6)-methyltransferase TrmO [Litorilituus sediminis]
MTSAVTDSIAITPIAYIESPYKEKFAIPRQPGLASAAKGKVILCNEANDPQMVRELAQYSHIWLLFVFHGTQNQGWKPLVRPPRLGGNKKIGVLATRSTFRPNPIGMSVVKLDKVEDNSKQVVLHISGLDLLDKTPIIDIKPYVPYSDALSDAQAGFAQQQPSKQLSVHFTAAAKAQIAQFKSHYPDLANLIEQVLKQDPRPAYKADKLDEKQYGMSLYDFNISWKMIDLTQVNVLSVVETDKK